MTFQVRFNDSLPPTLRDSCLFSFPFFLPQPRGSESPRFPRRRWRSSRTRRSRDSAPWWRRFPPSLSIAWTPVRYVTAPAPPRSSGCCIGAAQRCDGAFGGPGDESRLCLGIVTSQRAADAFPFEVLHVNFIEVIHNKHNFISSKMSTLLCSLFGSSCHFTYCQVWTPGWRSHNEGEKFCF